MIILLGKTLVFWTGIILGIFFILSFLGCRCLNGKCSKILGVTKHHTKIIKSTFGLFLIHATLGILQNFGVYI